MGSMKDDFKRKVPTVRIDKSLDKYDNVELFPEKLTKANKMLHKVGSPEDSIKNTR
ncbi:MAG: hypothetical protein JWQ63_3207 [Mucilaginibacter sp.]|nr:hypothetical protein [Mucilaginibacter sp.]